MGARTGTSYDGGAFHQRIRIGDSHHFQCGLGRCQVAPKPAPRRIPPAPDLSLRWHDAGTGPGRGRMSLCAKRIGILGFQIVGAQLGVVGTGHIQHGLALVHFLPWNHHHPADRAAYLCDHRRGLKAVVGHCPGQPQSASQAWKVEPSPPARATSVPAGPKRVRECSGSLGWNSWMPPFPLRCTRQDGEQHQRQRSRHNPRQLAIVTRLHCEFLILSSSPDFLMAGSSSPPLVSIVPARSYRKPGPGDKPVAPHGSCVRRPENPAGWPRPPCRHTR